MLPLIQAYVLEAESTAKQRDLLMDAVRTAERRLGNVLGHGGENLPLSSLVDEVEGMCGVFSRTVRNFESRDFEVVQRLSAALDLPKYQITCGITFVGNRTPSSLASAVKFQTDNMKRDLRDALGHYDAGSGTLRELVLAACDRLRDSRRGPCCIDADLNQRSRGQTPSGGLPIQPPQATIYVNPF